MTQHFRKALCGGYLQRRDCPCKICTNCLIMREIYNYYAFAIDSHLHVEEMSKYDFWSGTEVFFMIDCKKAGYYRRRDMQWSCCNNMHLPTCPQQSLACKLSCALQHRGNPCMLGWVAPAHAQEWLHPVPAIEDDRRLAHRRKCQHRHRTGTLGGKVP